jgi:hypothetical protein
MVSGYTLSVRKVGPPSKPVNFYSLDYTDDLPPGDVPDAEAHEVEPF